MPLSLSLFLIGLHGAVALALGSFFGMLVHRAPQGKSLLHPSSHCPKCGTSLKWFDNIPLLSYLWLGGKCRSCKAKIGLHYLWLELITFLLGLVLSFAHFYLGWMPGHTGFYSFFILCLWTPPLIYSDLKHFILPDSLTYSGLVLGILLSLFPVGISFYSACLSALGMATFIWLLGWIVGKFSGKEALGLGDVKLVAMTGALMGWIIALSGLMLASLLGVIYALSARSFASRKLDEEIPFGPFICLGTVICSILIFMRIL